MIEQCSNLPQMTLSAFFFFLFRGKRLDRWAWEDKEKPWAGPVNGNDTSHNGDDR